MEKYANIPVIGLDVGSTTVKAVVLDGDKNILWKNYERHRTKQVEKVIEFLERIKKDLGIKKFRLFTVGSGGQNIANLLGGKFIQEVNAVSYSVEKTHPEAGSVFELGGQDAKFIVWIKDQRGKRKFASMNDKCAGGTGATIDRILMKLNLDPEEVRKFKYSPEKVHPVAGKCGVFAETDINSLQKSGVPNDELIISLFDAIVLQNLTVLTRGYTPRPKVLLLGGPNAYFPALREAWEYRIKELWKERGIEEGEIEVPENALYYAALGAALLGSDFEKEDSFIVEDLSPLYRFLEEREKLKAVNGGPGLWKTKEELDEFLKQYKPKKIEAPKYPKGSKVNVYIGVDGGSTSTKGVILDEEGNLLKTAYKLSEGNPIEDTKEILKKLYEELKRDGIQPVVKGIGFTGYAKDLLKTAFGGDVAVVETVAHTLGSLKYFPDAEVICDVGGQDIKIIVLSDGKVKDFKLNTQCSAGNGYYLQATAQRFGYKVEEYADVAFKAKYAPKFNFGCAVFLEADIVNFQRLGWTAEEIMAGLAKVLPLNVWLYVAQEPNLRRLGKVFVLQGGTHKNLAVVKAQVDYIKEKVPEAKVYVHPFGSVAGAMGAALEAQRVSNGKTSFIGFENLDKVEYTAKRGEETRCHFCKNLCIRTFIDLKVGDETKRYIIATCDKGQVESREELRKLLGNRNKLKEKYPNFAEISNQLLFKSYKPPKVVKEKGFLNLFRKEKLERLKNTVVGIPRVLNIYSYAPFFRTYFEALGVKKVVFSDYTSEELYRRGSKRGSIDPCFPSKVAIAHVYNLLYEKRGVNLIFFPCVRTLMGEIYKAEGHWACPTVSATPEVVKAAYTKEKDEFKEKGVLYLDPVLDFEDIELLERELYKTFHPLWGITKEENQKAVEEGLKALESYKMELQTKAKEILQRLEEEGKVGIVALARPYHKDPGLNHGILEELNKLGYPIFTIESLPRDEETLNKLFGEEIEKGIIEHPMDIRNLWKKCYSENSSLKVWAAKYASLHPNLAAVDLSSFRCGHDAPIYSLIEEILESTDTPYFTFHELDENRPAGSIKIRVETIDYFLKRYEEEVLKQKREVVKA
jgi:predicted CoA-substrate-specific enzyme activase